MSDHPSARVKVVICGSVDDGKSTLVARLLLDTGNLTDDDAARATSEADGSALAGLLDGLAAEREQAITIDVAYRYFATPRRSVVLIDCPGHEHYTRNMVTGASNAELAIVLVDATRGVSAQTRRHCRIAHLLGIGDFVFAVNKMDRVENPMATLAAIARALTQLADEIGLARRSIIPTIATTGANIARRAADLAGYDGPCLIEAIEAFEPTDRGDVSLRLPVQTVIRSGDGERRLAGTVASGRIGAGSRVRIMPGAQEAEVVAVHVGVQAVPDAGQGRAVAITLDRPVDCTRGDMICAADDPPLDADQFEADIAWLGDKPMLAGRAYLFKLATGELSATLQQPKHRLDVETGQELAARTLRKNDIGVAVVTTARPIPADPYAVNRTTGGFILIDRESGDTVAAGMIRHALRRSQNIAWQELTIDRSARALQKGHAPRILWFTGLSGAGKTTIANLVEQRLYEAGLHSYMLDGDNVRTGLNKDLGFTDADRVENVRRVGEVATLMADAGLIVLATFISPFRAERDMVRQMAQPGEFIEVHVDVPLAVAEDRDPKGLYAKARRGEIANFTGLDSPYEAPENPDLTIDTTMMSAAEAADRIARHLIASLASDDD